MSVPVASQPRRSYVAKCAKRPLACAAARNVLAHLVKLERDGRVKIPPLSGARFSLI
ncbi:MAG: hypothetical protein KGM97_00705 [Alphaproteobacteria bacterium]|nr:hypothetical protein [Alphaproteobacteria bacterium]MDE2629482.1 hypothetical protein [Alphaproteobacteria bacterium]